MALPARPVYAAPADAECCEPSAGPTAARWGQPIDHKHRGSGRGSTAAAAGCHRRSRIAAAEPHSSATVASWLWARGRAALPRRARQRPGSPHPLMRSTRAEPRRALHKGRAGRRVHGRLPELRARPRPGRADHLAPRQQARPAAAARRALLELLGLLRLGWTAEAAGEHPSAGQLP